MPNKFQPFWNIMELCDWNNEGEDDKVLKPVIEYLSRQSDHAIFEFDDLMSELLYSLDTKELADQCEKVKRGKEKSLWSMEFEALIYVPQEAWALKHKSSVDNYPHCTPFCFETGSNKDGWQ
ncbi:MAG: DUF4240 domain-containing protein [Lachnospiraceae bacterium]|nr:DUF4240 domain-containing protein [Lachnospiraceae bacterium]